MTTLLLTDTGKLRNPDSGTAQDLPEPLDFVKFTEAVRGIGGMLESLAQYEFNSAFASWHGPRVPASGMVWVSEVLSFFAH